MAHRRRAKVNVWRMNDPKVNHVQSLPKKSQEETQRLVELLGSLARARRESEQMPKEEDDGRA